MSTADLEAIVSELRPLLGARIQRIDVIAPREVVLELRVPGRTLRLLASARPDLGRLCLVERRPPRLVPPGQLQSILRARLTGQPLLGLHLEGRAVRLRTRRLDVVVRIDGGKAAFALEPPTDPGETIEVRPIPDDFPRARAAGADYAERAPAALDDALRAALARTLRARRRKLRRLLGKVEGDERRLASFQDAGEEAELLKTVMHRIERGAREVEVIDWTTGAPRTLALDPALSPKQNLERRFARAKKARRGLPRVQARLEAVRADLAQLDARLEALEGASREALEAWTKDWSDAPADRAPSGRGAARAHPLDKFSRAFTAKDGSTIRVGKGAAANDRLTFSGAKGTDIWLHARGVTGAHVILSNAKGAAPHPEALLDAAHLAVHYSSAKGEAKAEVIHTEVRHVKKTKGAPAGQVGIAKSKTMLVRMERARLDRLLGREGG